MRRVLAGLVVAAAILGPAGPAFADHDGGREKCRWEGDCGQSYDGQWSNEDRNRNRDRNRGAFSPGPFDRSPIDFSHSSFCISLDCSGRDQKKDRPPPSEGRPQQLFPPSADGIRNFVTSTVQAGIEMGRIFADTTITFVSNLLVGIA